MIPNIYWMPGLVSSNYQTDSVIIFTRSQRCYMTKLGFEFRQSFTDSVPLTTVFYIQYKDYTHSIGNT